MGHKSFIDRNQNSLPSFIDAYQADINIRLYPEIFDPKGKSEKEFQKFCESKLIADVTDVYAEQFAELLLSQEPHLYKASYEIQKQSINESLEAHYKGLKTWQVGIWVYYPWLKKLVHILSPKEFHSLRTIRNKNLITSSEQAALQKLHIGCAGMSVGSAAALAISISGISDNIKLADGAVISGSNLNRVLTGVYDVGVPKSTIIARKIWEMNPYASVMEFDAIDNKSIKHFFDKNWKLDLVIDEVDDLKAKVLLRLAARDRKIPLLMATELGDTVILDVERFDLQPSRAIFHGRVKGIDDISKLEKLSQREWMKIATDIIDVQNMPVKLQKSLLNIGSTIVTHPQLGSTVMMTGGILVYAIKAIFLENDLKSGRYRISLEHLTKNFFEAKRHQRTIKTHAKQMKRITKEFK